MWSAGIIHYSLVCNGTLPFKLIDRMTLFESIKYDEPDTYNYEYCFQLRETKELILKMLNKDPIERITPEKALNHKYFKTNGHNLQVYN